jgi:NADH pyrophosphatase NudC (nudix superfamily)
MPKKPIRRLPLKKKTSKPKVVKGRQKRIAEAAAAKCRCPACGKLFEITGTPRRCPVCGQLVYLNPNGTCPVCTQRPGPLGATGIPRRCPVCGKMVVPVNGRCPNCGAAMS